MKFVVTVFSSLCLASLITSANAQSANICVSTAGDVLFTDQVCPSGYKLKEQKIIDTRASGVDRIGGVNANKSGRNLIDVANMFSAQRDKDSIERRLNSITSDMQALDSSRDSEVGPLRSLVNEIAGVNARNRQQAIEDQINGINSNYNEQRSALEKEQNALQEQLRKLIE